MKKWKKKKTKRLPRSALYYMTLALVTAVTAYYITQTLVSVEVLKKLRAPQEQQQEKPSGFTPTLEVPSTVLSVRGELKTPLFSIDRNNSHDIIRPPSWYSKQKLGFSLPLPKN